MKLQTSTPSNWTDLQEAQRQEVSRIEAPLFERLKQFQSEKRLSFHMPGWRTERSFSSLDCTELGLTEDLNHPGTCLKEAEQALASFYGVREARFLTEGSSSGLTAALLALAGRGGCVLAPRSTHRFLWQTALRYNLTIYCPKQALEEGAFLPLPTVEAYEEVLIAYPEVRVLVTTAPNYYGEGYGAEEEEAIEALCRRYGVTWLVDAAHAAHFSLLGRMPRGDVLVCSAHKMLPALTGSAYLLMRNLTERQMRAVDTAIRLERGSSPPLYVAASADHARAYAQTMGRTRLQRQLEEQEACLSDLPFGLRRRRHGRLGQPLLDPYRITLDCAEAGGGFVVQKALEEQGVDVELADWRYVVLLPSLDFEEGVYSRLREALEQMVLPSEGVREEQVEALDQAFRQCFAQNEASFYAPAKQSETLPWIDGEVEFIPLEEACGRQVAEALLVYPPGLPLCWAGESLSEAVIEQVQSFLEAGASVYGVEEDDGQKIAVWQRR